MIHGRLGGINLNNMMPIPKSCLELIKIENIKDLKYKIILKSQIEWIEQNEFRIRNRARNLYYLILNNHISEALLERCCDFRLLEKRCDEFMKENNLNEEEILYCYFNLS